jgi:hypothetical protein
MHGKLFLADQIKWARQITQSLIHIQALGPGYYCDLRLDNILLSETDDSLLIDFEQRGLMPPFAAPEVNYLQYIEILANDQSLPGCVVDKYQTLYKCDISPNVLTTKNIYHADSNGYSIPWLCFTAPEREAAEVYMLGRVLWCIFEGVSAPEITIWLKYKHDPDLNFPEFYRTPVGLRGLISSCTKGWISSEIQQITRVGKHLAPVVQRGYHREGDPVQVLRRGWRQELVNAVSFLKQRREVHSNSEEDTFGRPTLKEILKVLDGFPT